MNTPIRTQWLVSCTLLLMVFAVPIQARYGGELVGDVVKAPVAADGTTAGRPTDFVINLNTTLDPSINGRTLLKGKTIRVTLPDDFKEASGFPFMSVGPGCMPPLGSAMCNTAVLLQGWPQHPIGPPFMKYSFHYEAASNTVIYTALK